MLLYIWNKKNNEWARLHLISSIPFAEFIILQYQERGKCIIALSPSPLDDLSNVLARDMRVL